MINLLTTIFTIILTPIMGLLTWQLKRCLTTRESDSNGIKTLLRATMRELHVEYIARGYVNSDELAEFKELYDAYHNLKGNGKGTIWMEDVEKLERKEY